MNRFSKFLINLALSMLIASTNALASGGGHGGGSEDSGKRFKGGGIEETRPSNERSKALLAKLRDGDFGHMGGASAIHLFLDKLIRINPKISKGNTLDVGCGHGGTANFLYGFGFDNIWGIDLDEDAIKHSKQKYPGVQFSVADATKLTDIFEDEFFSLVYMFNVAHEVNDKAAMLQKIKSVCKDDAILAIFDYTLKDPSRDRYLTDINGLPMHPINMDQFRLLLRVIGWEVVEVVDITDYFRDWYDELFDKIDERRETLKAIGYTDEEIQDIKNVFVNLLDLINDDKLSGTILFAKKT